MSRLDDFRFARWLKKLNRVTQVILCVILWLAINYVAAIQFFRKDITHSHKYSLSQETLKYIEKIREPVDIYVSTATEQPRPEIKGILDDIKNLLREYEYAGRTKGKKMINVHHVNVFRDKGQAEIMVKKFNVDRNKENAIVVACGDTYREILTTQLYEDNDHRKFRGEQLFTSCILNVASPEKRKVYWLSGHGEISMDDISDRGLSRAAESLRQNNLELVPLDLTKGAEVPEDAELVMIAAPMAKIAPYEVEKLRQYLDSSSGRIMVFLHPGLDHGLDDMFWKWGILADDMLVIVSEDYLAPGGGLPITDFGEHPISNFLKKSEIPVLLNGDVRPVREDPGTQLDERLKISNIMSTPKLSYAERNYMQTPYEFSPDYDLLGPISIGMVAERTVDSNLGLDIPGGRLVVYGNTHFVTNRIFDAYGNSILFENTVNWLIGEDDFLAIPPRIQERFQLPLNQSDLTTIILLLLTLPGCALLLGGIISLMRRR